MVEHIEQDERVLHEIHHALIPGTGAVFTVPQHPRLWSAHDERGCHKRRYRRHKLSDKLQRADFRIIFSSLFVSFMLRLLAVPRRRRRGSRHTLNAEADCNLTAPANAFLYQILGLDKSPVTQDACLPAGGTRLGAAVKVTSTRTGATCRHTPSEQPG